jgi:putative transposase
MAAVVWMMGGFWVSTVGRDGAVICDYIRNQEKEDQRLEQMLPW